MAGIVLTWDATCVRSTDSTQDGVEPQSSPMQAVCGHGRNEILAALAANGEALLGSGAQIVHLNERQVLALADEPIEYVYFPLSAVVSLLVPMEDGTAVEGATIGWEGMVGLHAFLGQSATAEELVVQVGGDAVRMLPDQFRSMVARHGELQKLLYGYTLAFIAQLARTAGCNQVHSVGQRVARSLLMHRDRVGQDTFPLTHESLATLLAVRRASVTQAAEALQASGVVTYRRGSMTIVDTRRLEAESCEDYRLSRDAYQALYS